MDSLLIQYRTFFSDINVQTSKLLLRTQQQLIFENIILAMDENILQQQVHDNSYQLKIKMKYLQEDKEKLQVSCAQLKQSVQLLRFINQELIKKEQININKINLHINQQNKKLQQSYLRILNQNQQLVCENLMHRQILSEAENQYKQILKGYEQKIIQLRRSIQFKESCIQGYEANAKMSNNNFQIGNVPPSNVSMLFFSEIDELKRTIQSLNYKNKQLLTTNANINSKYEQMTKKLNLLQNYLRVPCTYSQIRNIFLSKTQGKTKRNKSQTKNVWSQSINFIKTNKKNSQIKPTQTIQAKKNVQLQTRQTSSFQSSSKLYQLKNLLKKKSSQFDILVQKYNTLEAKYKKNQKTRKQLVQGNNFYKQKRQNNYQELNYYKKSTFQLLSLLAKRKIKRNYSANKNKTDQFIDSLKKPQEFMNVTDRKEFWIKIQRSLKSTTNNSIIKFQGKRMKKSLSDVLTYTSINHSGDYTDQIYSKNNKKINNIGKQQLNAFINQKYNDKVSQEYNYQQTQNVNQFSRFLTSSLGKDQQFSIIKPNQKISLADRKKMKKQYLANNLTIIQQNIL